MGYDWRIGDAFLEDVSDGTEACLRVAVRGQSHLDAPTFPNDEMTGNGNMRSPSYTGWVEFCKATGLHNLFYGGGWCRDSRQYLPCVEPFHRETPLRHEHPGFAAINKHDVEHVAQRLADYRAANPGVVPGFTGWDYSGPELPEHNVAAHMARLIWLHWWMDWAVKNCEHPVVANS